MICGQKSVIETNYAEVLSEDEQYVRVKCLPLPASTSVLLIVV